MSIQCNFNRRDHTEEKYDQFEEVIAFGFSGLLRASQQFRLHTSSQLVYQTREKRVPITAQWTISNSQFLI